MPDAIDRLIARRKIIDASGRYGLPPALALGLAESESGFDQSATSRTGARGVFQFTRATAREMGIDREDVDQNIDAGVRYLAQLLSETNDPAEAFRRYKGVSAGGAAESDVTRALELVSSHANGKKGDGNAYLDRKPGSLAEPEVDEVGYLIERRKGGADPIPSRAELDSLTADLTPRRERIEAAAVEIMARKTALEEKRSQLRHSRDLPELKKEVDLFNSDLKQYQAEVRAYDQDASHYHAGSRVFNRNAERIRGHTVTRPGVPMPRVPVEEVPQGLAEAIPAPIAAPLLGVGKGVASLVLGFGALAEPAAAAVEQAVAAVEQESGKTIGSAALRKIGSPALRKIGETFRGWQEKVQDATIEALKPYEGKTIGSHPELKYDPVYMGNLIGNAVGSMAGYMVPGQAVGRMTLAGLGRVAPRLVQGRDVLAKGAQLFATAGTGAMLESLVEAGDNYATALADPQISSLPPEEGEKIALTVFADTAKKSFPVTFVTNLAGAYAPREGAAWFTKLAHVILDPTMEGVQEVLQGEAAHAALAKAIPDLPERTGRLEEFIGGFAAGGVVGGMRTLNQAARERRRRRKGGKGGPPGAAPAAPSPTTPPAGAPVEPELHARVLAFVSESPKPVSLLDLGKGLGIGPGPAREILEGLAEDGKLQPTQQGNRTLYTVPGAAKPTPRGEGWTPPGAAVSPEAASDNRQRVLEIAQREGRITAGGIANSLNISGKEARGILSELIQDGELNSRGNYIGKTAADERAARQAPIALAERETTYEAPEASHVPAERRGETAEVVTPQGTTAQAQWVLTDLGDVVASHDLAGNENPDYPQQYQGRQRERVASRAQIEEIARTFDPAQATESRVSSGGAPIDVIGEDGRQIVVSGNGRTLAQRLVYQLHPQRSQAYRKHLAAVLPKYGIDPKQMKGMKTPSLRRVLRGPVALGRFASESNAETVARRSPAEVAAGDAQKLTPELLQDFKPSETGEIGTPANSGFVRDFFETAIPSAERGSYMQPDGTLSQEGERRLRNAIFARAYGDVAGVERLAESREDAARSVSDGMLRAAPAFAQMAADIESGNLHALDTSKDLAAAARKFAFLRTRGLTVDGFLAQQPMFERELSPEAERWLQVFDKHGRAPKRTGQILHAYSDAVRALGHPQQQPMFERGALPAKLDIIERAVQAIVSAEQEPAPQPAPIPAEKPPVVQTSAKVATQPPTPPKPATRPKPKAPAPATPAAPSLFKEAGEPPAVTDQEVAEALRRDLEATGRAAAERLKARLRDLAADTAGGITPQRISGEQVSELLEDLRAVGAWKVSAGAVRLQKFTDSMVAELGEWVREHIGTLHEAALDEFEATGETKRRELAGETKAPTPELAVEDLYPRAVALAKQAGRASATAIAEDLAIPREEARELYARLVRERVVNSVGRVIAAEAPAKKAEPKPETPPVEQVPIEALRELAEYDRRLPEQRPETREGMPTADYVSGLARDLKEHGFEEPLVVRYDPARRVVALVEGNYRIAAAAEAGIQTAPVIVDVGEVLTDGRPAALKPGVETPRSLADIIQQPLQPLAPPQPQAPEARPRTEGPRFITKPPAIRQPESALAPVEAKPEPPAATPKPVSKKPAPTKPTRQQAQLGLFAGPPAEQPKYDYSSTQVNLPGPVAKRLAEAAARIPDQDLAEDGRETQPHVTVLYGLHGEDAEAVRELIENEPPIRLKFGKASFFPNGESGSGDVVKVDVESADLRRLNQKIGIALPNTQTQPGYKPHATIAYVKPGLGKKYTGKPVPGVSGQEITLDRIVFSSRSGRQTEIELRGKHAPPFVTKPPAIRKPEAAAPAKQPWEMTRAEWRLQENRPKYDAIVAAIKAGKPIQLITQWKTTLISKPGHIRLTAEGDIEIARGRHWDFPTDPGVDSLAHQAGMKLPDFYDRIYHHAEVETAVAEGKPVPAEVLADYPDLAKPPAAEETPSETYDAFTDALRAATKPVRELVSTRWKFLADDASLKRLRDTVAGAEEVLEKIPAPERSNARNALEAALETGRAAIAEASTPAAPSAEEPPALHHGQEVTFPSGENVAFRQKYGKRVPGTIVAVDGRVIEEHGRGRRTVLVKVGKANHTVPLEKITPAEAPSQKARFTQGTTIRWTAPDGRKLYGFITSVSDTEYRVRAHPVGEPSEVRTQTIEYVPFDAENIRKDTGGPETGPVQEPAAKVPQQRLIGRVRQAIIEKEDIRLRLEKLAQEIYGGSRAGGAFSKRDIYEAQEAAVNSWLRDNAGRLNGMEFADAQAELRDVLSRLATQTVRDLEQIERQQFSTPPTIAHLVARLAAPQPTDVALEPSAGTGGLAALIDPMVAKMHLNELDPDRAALAVAAGLPPATHHNAEVISAHLAGKVKPDLVVMNPPFTRGALQQAGKNRIKYGWNHLESALQLLKGDGRLVAILVGGRENFQDREGAGLMVPAARQYWDRITGKHNVRAVVRIAGKEYAKYGTSMPIIVAVIDKTGPTPGATFAERAAHVQTGSYDTVGEAWDAVQNIAESREAIARSGEAGRAPAVRGRSGDLLAGVPALGEEPGPQPRRTGGHRLGDVELEAGKPGEGVGRPQPGPALDRPASVPAGLRGTEGAPESAVRGRRDLEVQAAEAAGTAAVDAGSFVVYQPSIKGQPHQGLLVETKTMASVKAPPLTYRPSLPQGIIEKGKLSAAQLESVVMAGQANETTLPDGSRGAALVGDGTGVGKGRQIAAILLDNWNKGRRRLVWVTENWRLIEDARRDLVDIGAHDLARTLKRADKFRHGTPIGHQGVLFAPYSWIRAYDKSNPPKHRVDQLIKWTAGEDEGDGAVVVFDESHNLKNTEPAAAIKPSQTGLAVKKLLDKAPKLRTTYMSATAATELRNLGYLRRLGLWGPKTAFPGGFSEFLNHLGRGGMSAMEMLARELKALGKYTSRTISYKGVILREDAVHTLNEDQRQIYRTSAHTWREVLDWVGQGIEAANAGSQALSGFMSQFYGRQQSFFNLLLTTMKVPTAVAEARKALNQDYSVVISLINTNEANQQRQKAKMKEAGEEDETDNLDFGPKDILVNLVKDHFPTAQWADATDEAGNQIKVIVKDSSGKVVQNPEAIKLRDQLVEKLDKDLHLPANPLDILIEELGGRAAVAELTGRQEIYDQATGKFIPRGDRSVPRHRVNIVEAEAFQQGKKRIAILSNAAATGISLHADRTKRNLQRRLQITLQVGWSADKAMQMLGRTHRTNQEHAPEYLMMVSDMGGEKRFISTIARRLGTLGALTKGSREAAGANAEAISKVNFDSREGRQAADGLYNYLLSDQEVPGTDLSGRDVLGQMGVLRINPRSGEEYVADTDRQNVNRLLNRLLALDPDIQNPVYDLYYDMFERSVQIALDNGTLDVGVKELPGERPRIVETTSLATDEETGAETFHYVVETEVRHNRASVDDLDRLQRKHPEGEIHRIVNQRTQEEHLAFAWPAPPIIHADGRSEDAFYVVRPDRARPEKFPAHRLGYQKTLKDAATADRTVIESELSYNRQDLERQESYQKRSREPERYERGITDTKARITEKEKQLAQLPGEVDFEQLGREEWQKAYDATPEFDTQRHNLIGGTVLKWWGVLSEGGVLNIYGAQDAETGQRIVGVEVASTNFRSVVDRISGGASTVTPRQIWRDVLDNATPYTLRGNLRVTRGRVSREDIVRFHPSPEQAKVLTDLGVTYERGVVPIYWVPRSDQGFAILERVLEQYPAETARGERAGRGILEDTAGELRLDAMQEFFTAPVQGLAKLKNPFRAAGSSIKKGFLDLAESMAAPVDWRLGREGGQFGKDLMRDLNLAENLGANSAGQRLVRLADADLKRLSRGQRFNLLDVLEGRDDPADDGVWEAYRVVRPMLDEIAAEAEALRVRIRTREGLRDFEALEDYFPHLIRKAEKLTTGPVRADIIENLVRLRIRDNEQQAAIFLDDYIDYVESGGRGEQLLQHLQDTGQAANEAEAAAMLERHRKHIRRHGAIEYAREINLPFYDPDPWRVLPTHVSGASMRLAQIAILGQADTGLRAPVINYYLREIDKRGGDHEWIGQQVDKMIGWVNGTDQKAERAARAFRAFNALKLTSAAIPNITQTLNSLLAADLPAVVIGIHRSLSKPGQRFAMQSGATIDSILHESLREFAGQSRLLEKYLRSVGFSVTERINRTLAANIGAVYSERLLKKLLAKPQHKRARRVLAEFGVDVDAAISRGRLTGDDLLLVAKQFSDRTQFRARPQDHPAWATDTAWGRAAYQFKQYPYGQMRLLKRELYDELVVHHEVGRAFRSVLLLSTIYPLTGAAIIGLRNLLFGRDWDLEGLWAYLDSAAQVGVLSMMWDIMQASEYRRLPEFIGGPSVQVAGEAVALARDPAEVEAWKKAYYRHGAYGSIVRRIAEGPAD